MLNKGQWVVYWHETDQSEQTCAYLCCVFFNSIAMLAPLLLEQARHALFDKKTISVGTAASW